ncbi:hypothetical protein Tco_1488652, partial [Tanacetum coccineum]
VKDGWPKGGFLYNAWLRLSDVSSGRVGKGGSWVLIPNLVIMAKVGASGHPTDHLGTGRILLFDSIPLLQ